MKEYDVFMADGTYIEIEAEGWFVEDGVISFFDVPEDECFNITAMFNLSGIAGFAEVME